MGHHTHNMLSMLFILHPSPTYDLIMAVHFHDKAEYKVGDAPSPGLRENPELNLAYIKAERRSLKEDFGVQLHFLHDDEARWLNALDRLEAFFFGKDQLYLGNVNANEIIGNLFRWFLEMYREGNLPEPIRKLLNEEYHSDERIRAIWPSSLS